MTIQSQVSVQSQVFISREYEVFSMWTSIASRRRFAIKLDCCDRYLCPIVRHPQKVAARKAIVAVARKLTTGIYAVLKEQRPFILREENWKQPNDRIHQARANSPQASPDKVS